MTGETGGKRQLSQEEGKEGGASSKRAKTEDVWTPQQDTLDLLDERLSVHNEILQSMEQSLLETDGNGNAIHTEPTLATAAAVSPVPLDAQAGFTPATRLAPPLLPREPTTKPTAESSFLADPEAFVDSLLLPTLANMATALLDFVIRCSPDQLTSLLEQPHSPLRRSWDRILYAFESTRAKFRSGSRYIDPASVAYLPIRRNDDRSPQDSVGVINIASATAELLVPTYQGLVDLQSRLPDIFEPFAQFIQAERMELIGGLLTQVHLARLKESLKRRELAHEDPFAQDLERHLTQHIAGDGTLNLRNEFWLKCRTIRQQLVNSTLADLVTSDCRLRFSRSLRRYLDENVRPGALEFAGLEEGSGDGAAESVAHGESLLSGYSQPADEPQDEDDEAMPFDQDMDAMIRAAAREARANMSGQNYGGNVGRKVASTGANSTLQASAGPQAAAPVTSGHPTAMPAANAAVSRAETSTASPATGDADASIIEKYKQARLADAATERQKQDRARSSSGGQRRAWSNEEEQALMQGLDKVQGPHWAKILAMFGENGSVSNVLKDRNQVQCKDKARNLKLYFLKGGHELPPGLKLVTGELKTRAPGRASKLEMHEQLQRSASEDKATSDAISALVGGPRPASSNGLQESNALASNSTLPSDVGGEGDDPRTRGDTPTRQYAQANDEFGQGAREAGSAEAVGGTSPAIGAIVAR